MLVLFRNKDCIHFHFNNAHTQCIYYVIFSCTHTHTHTKTVFHPTLVINKILNECMNLQNFHELKQDNYRVPLALNKRGRFVLHKPKGIWFYNGFLCCCCTIFIFLYFFLFFLFFCKCWRLIHLHMYLEYTLSNGCLYVYISYGYIQDLLAN